MTLSMAVGCYRLANDVPEIFLKVFNDEFKANFFTKGLFENINIMCDFYNRDTDLKEIVVMQLSQVIEKAIDCEIFKLEVKQPGCSIPAIKDVFLVNKILQE
ncbi:hypothetical protein CEXT_375191 [Caerostris extrusa]|uniref:Uncharacterized protein n=1 Tax=Caerostris extrusa TaxID=172846 RepID=A0AAV4UB74_CAEEX|nr:hypothetical protein CEXT_375191 [Caerostris extrusa]